MFDGLIGLKMHQKVSQEVFDTSSPYVAFRQINSHFTVHFKILKYERTIFLHVTYWTRVEESVNKITSKNTKKRNIKYLFTSHHIQWNLKDRTIWYWNRTYNDVSLYMILKQNVSRANCSILVSSSVVDWVIYLQCMVERVLMITSIPRIISHYLLALQ